MRPFWKMLMMAVLLAWPDRSRAADAAKDEDGFVRIFDGKTMNGWKVAERPDTFKIVDGALVAKGDRAHCFYVGDEKPFVDFQLKIDVLTRPKANGGVYFHTRWQETGFPRGGFECQVNQTHSDPKKTGSLYNIKNVMDTSPVKDDEWWEYDIMVKGKTVTIKVNGKVTAREVVPN